jgi:hypothetical protein
VLVEFQEDSERLLSNDSRSLVCVAQRAQLFDHVLIGLVPQCTRPEGFPNIFCVAAEDAKFLLEFASELGGWHALALGENRQQTSALDGIGDGLTQIDENNSWIRTGLVFS